jgi:hypothetical protein
VEVGDGCEELDEDTAGAGLVETFVGFDLFEEGTTFHELNHENEAGGAMRGDLDEGVQ